MADDPIAWVHREKIRMGWSPERLEQYHRMAKAGMNAVMPRFELDVVLEYDPAKAAVPVSPRDAEVMRNILEGSRLAKELGLHYFHCLNFAAESQTYEVGFQDNPARFNDGRLPSPVDPIFWKRTIVDRVARVLDLLEDESTYALDAIIIDPEMYALGDALPGEADYGKLAFELFLAETSTQAPALSSPEARRAWLDEQGLQAKYERWQYQRIRDMAAELREMVHARRPNMILGYIIYENRMWFHAMAEGLSTPRLPVFIGPESTYSGVMDDRMIEYLDQIRREVKVPCLLTPGIMMVLENGRVPHEFLEVVPGNVYQRCQYTEGYWVYAIYGFGDTDEQQQPFFDAIKIINDALDEQMRTGQVVAGLQAAPLPTKTPAGFKDLLSSAASWTPLPNSTPRADLPAAPVKLRGSYAMVLWPQPHEGAMINLRAIKLGVYLDACQALLFSQDGRLIWKDEVSFERTVGLKVPGEARSIAGAIIGAGMNAFEIESTTCPMMIVPEDWLAVNAQRGFAGRFYFYVPAGRDRFRLSVQGHPVETADYAIYDPAGPRVDRVVQATQNRTLEISVTTPGVWCIEVDNVVDDAGFKLDDLPNRFAIRPEHVWTDSAE
ncbi:MAG TPA: hypothetical protein VF184_13215 [Phycisphaeraceae bacterium]